MPYGKALVDTIETSGDLAITGNVTASGSLSVTGNLTTSGTITSNTGTTYPLITTSTVNTTSGTTVTVATNIPSWVKRVTVIFNAVSTNGTGIVLIQFGTGSTPTYTTSGYLSGADNYYNTPGPVTRSTNGFRLGVAGQAVSQIICLYTFVLVDPSTNTWVGSLSGYDNSGGGNPLVLNGGGNVTLSDTLTAIRLNTTTGTDVFDAGTVNILYE